MSEVEGGRGLGRRGEWGAGGKVIHELLIYWFGVIWGIQLVRFYVYDIKYTKSIFAPLKTAILDGDLVLANSAQFLILWLGGQCFIEYS